MASRTVFSSVVGRGVVRTARCLSAGSTSSAPTSSSSTRTPLVAAAAAAACASRHSSTAASSSSSSSSDDYVSPFADFFQNIADGKTTLQSHIGGPLPTPEARVLKCGVPESALRFKTVSNGRMIVEPYVQPGEHKVTMKVGMHVLPLETELEHTIFRQIVGRRYIPERNELRLTSDQFASRIENKRHLVSMLDRIIINTKRLAKESAEGADDGSEA